MRRPLRQWKVTVGLHSVLLTARSRGNACRKAFREFIAAGYLKRQPKTCGMDSNTPGFFEGVEAQTV